MTATISEELTEAWSKLQALVPIKTIHTEQQYDRAVTALNMLIDTVGADDQHPLADLLDTLGALIQTYEQQHEPEPVAANSDIVQFLMEEHGLTPEDLKELGEPAMVLDILAGKHPLTSAQCQALARRFGVLPETFQAS